MTVLLSSIVKLTLDTFAEWIHNKTCSNSFDRISFQLTKETGVISVNNRIWYQTVLNRKVRAQSFSLHDLIFNLALISNWLYQLRWTVGRNNGQSMDVERLDFISIMAWLKMMDPANWITSLAEPLIPSSANDKFRLKYTLEGEHINQQCMKIWEIIESHLERSIIPFD